MAAQDHDDHDDHDDHAPNIHCQQWREKMLVQLTKVGGNQEHLEHSLKEYARLAEERFNVTDARLEKLEYIIYGNGTPGLAEKMRGLTAKVAFATAVIVFVAQALGSVAFHKLSAVLKP